MRSFYFIEFWLRIEGVCFASPKHRLPIWELQSAICRQQNAQRGVCFLLLRAETLFCMRRHFFRREVFYSRTYLPIAGRATSLERAGRMRRLSPSLFRGGAYMRLQLRPEFLQTPRACRRRCAAMKGRGLCCRESNLCGRGAFWLFLQVPEPAQKNRLRSL